jgi:hypothetical protein
MTLSEQLRYLDDVLTLWAVGELSADECWEYVQAVVDGVEYPAE